MRTLYYNGNIYTGEGKASAFVVEDGRFAEVGNEELKNSSYDRTVDLQGQFVCAAFNDSHMHLLGYGSSLKMADLARHTDSLQGMLEYLREYAAAQDLRPGQWIRGRGWNQDYFSDVQRMPDRHDLDSVSTEYPIVVTRTCGHSCVANTKALELAGISASTKPPVGGDIGREADGTPDGRLYDNAIDELLDPFIPLPDKEELKEMIRLACRALNSYGITSSQTDDYCVFREIPFETVNEAYKELEASGELTVRVYEQSNFTTLEELSRFVEAGNVTGSGTDFFKIGPLKMLGDGSLGARTAHLSRPYADDPSTSGFSLFTTEHMNAMVSYANAHGMQIAIHAIGDACLDQVLNAVDLALQEHPREDHRHGVVHCQISRADQLKRIEDLHMHVYAQSIFLDYDNHIVEKRVGSELASTSYCWKTLLKNGVCVSNGSDCPVELPDALEGIECAVTRTSLDGTGPYLAEEAFTVKEAIDSFTVNAARGSFEEDRKGKIKAGYQADFTVLGEDPFTADPRTIHAIPVRETWLAGRKVYQAK
ncbi:MAG: amidohydrolase [Erysipelotrichaceae bacterium]|nr:amidohydrolase [Erysipelotrichaceae bacterium]